MFQTDYYHLKSAKIKTPVKFVMLADLHNKSYGDENELLVEKIRECEPDFICVAGDLLIGHSQLPYDVAQNLVKTLAKEFKIFYGLGNHESRMRAERKIYGNRYEDYMKPLEEQGVKVLINANEELEVRGNRFRIYGYDLPMKYFEKFNRYVFESGQITDALGACVERENIYSILLAHNPVYFKQYAQWGADLTLSGHLHGGIIRLPLIGGVITPQAKLFPRYCAGEYRIKEHEMIVSRGLGTHTIPIRFLNPPELSVICLEPKEK